MAFFVGTVYSKAMRQDTSFEVILPQDGRRYQGQGNPKTLILLHGLSDNSATWVRRTAIERYAERYDLAVIMPEVQRSWYQDMAYGVQAFTFITDEVPELSEKMFHLSTKREDMLLAGLSMGGYGALQCALRKPERFGYCGAFSGAYDLEEMYRMACSPESEAVLHGMADDFRAIFSPNLTIPDESKLTNLLRSAENKQTLPEVYMMCGTEDFLYAQTQAILPLCTRSLPDFTYEEWAGHHEWDMWDEAIERMLLRFLGPGRKDYDD